MKRILVALAILSPFLCGAQNMRPYPLTLMAQLDGPSGNAFFFGFPGIPAGAETFSNLQDASYTWNQVDDSRAGSQTGCETEGNPPGVTTLTQGVASPSLSGASLEVTHTNTTGYYCNVLTYINLGCGSLAGGCQFTGSRYVRVDFYAYFPSSNVGLIQQYEYDPDLFDGTDRYFASLRASTSSTDCLSTGTECWGLWDTLNDSWTKTNIDASGFIAATGVWHHIQLLALWNRTAGTYQYIDFYVDGSPIFENAGSTYTYTDLADSGTAKMNFEFQMDGRPTSGTTTEYIDDVNFSDWPAS